MTKNIVITALVALAVSILVVFGFGNGQSNPGSVRISADEYPNGVQIGTYVVNQASINLGAGVNRASWKNTTGKDVFIDYVEASVVKTSASGFAYASSTSKINAYSTTTAPRTLYDFTAVAQEASTTIAINAFPIATSSAATTTSSIDKALAGKTVKVPYNGYLILELVQNTTGCDGAVGLCETATSTARGFNVDGLIRYHYKP